MFPIVDLNEVTSNCLITVAVGEATNSLTSGTLTVVIKNAAPGGSHLTISQAVNNLGQNSQIISITATPKTGKIHHVTASLTLSNGESSTDDEFIQLCKP